MVIKGLRFIILVKSAVIIHTVNLQYIPVIKVVNVNYRCCNYRVQDRESNTLFLFFLYLLLYILFFLNLFLKLK